MVIKDVVLVSVLIALGTIVNAIFPPVFMGMKPDFTLLILFIVILFKRDFKLTLVASIVTGIICAMTTGYPGGQIPNIIDKLVTSLIIYFAISRIGRHNLITSCITCFVGSLLSGIVFLSTVMILVGLSASLMSMITTIVLPLTCLNTVVFVIVVEILTKRNILRF